MAPRDAEEVRPSREFVRPSDFERGWFSRASVLPPTSLSADLRPIGQSGWSAWLGAISGGLGGLVMVIVAQGILDVRHSGIDIVRLLGRGATHSFVRFSDVRIGGLLCAAALGAVLGAPLGYLARRLLRIVPRLFFFTLLLPVFWLFVRTLVLGKLAPALATQLPFGPLLAGFIVYGACIGVVSPPSTGRIGSEFGGRGHH